MKAMQSIRTFSINSCAHYPYLPVNVGAGIQL
jgi:hypothetical protein